MYKGDVLDFGAKRVEGGGPRYETSSKRDGYDYCTDVGINLGRLAAEVSAVVWRRECRTGVHGAEASANPRELLLAIILESVLLSRGSSRPSDVDCLNIMNFQKSGSGSEG